MLKILLLLLAFLSPTFCSFVVRTYDRLVDNAHLTLCDVRCNFNNGRWNGTWWNGGYCSCQAPQPCPKNVTADELIRDANWGTRQCGPACRNYYKTLSSKPYWTGGFGNTGGYCVCDPLSKKKQKYNFIQNIT